MLGKIKDWFLGKEETCGKAPLASESAWWPSIMTEVERSQAEMSMKSQQYDDLSQMVRNMVKHLDRTGKGYHVTISVRAWFDFDQAMKIIEDLPAESTALVDCHYVTIKSTDGLDIDPLLFYFFVDSAVPKQELGLRLLAIFDKYRLPCEYMTLDSHLQVTRAQVSTFDEIEDKIKTAIFQMPQPKDEVTL